MIRGLCVDWHRARVIFLNTRIGQITGNSNKPAPCGSALAGAHVTARRGCHLLHKQLA